MRQGSQSAQTCGCDPGADWVCERHAAKDAEALMEGDMEALMNPKVPHATTENLPPTVPYVPAGWSWTVPSQSTAVFQHFTSALAPNRATTLPLTGEARKQYPLATGVLDYFPDALVAIAHVSYVGNDQHNPGEPVHWAREKSTDQADTLIRHFLERGAIDTDGQRHTAKMAWRALALLQLELEQANEVV